MANFNYKDIHFDDDFQLGSDDELLSLTRNLDLVTLAIRNKTTKTIHVRIYLIDPYYWFKFHLKWSGDMTAYIKTPRTNPVLNKEEYQKIQVYTLKCEYVNEYIVVCVRRKQTASTMKQIPNSYIIGNFHLVSVIDNSITVIWRVMPQNTKQCQNAVYSFIPYGQEFYSVIGVLDTSYIKDKSDEDCSYTRRENELYLTRGSIKLPNALDYEKIKRCSVKYDPVCNLNTLCNQSQNIKYCMFDSIAHKLYGDCNIITIECGHKYKITHNIAAMTLHNKITLETWKEKEKLWFADKLFSHRSSGFFKLRYTQHEDIEEHYEIKMELVIDGITQQFQIVNSWPHIYELNTNFIYRLFNYYELISENLLLIESNLNSKHKDTLYMLFNLDYNKLTATLVTCMNVTDTYTDTDTMSPDNIFAGIDNTLIIMNMSDRGTQLNKKKNKKNNKRSIGKTEFKIIYPSSQASLPPDLALLDAHLPYEMIMLVYKYIISSPVPPMIKFKLL